jgi:hypothetical protein
MIYNVQKLMVELESAGIPVEGCSSDGRIDFLAAATDAQRTLAAQILAAHDPLTPLQSEIDRQTDLNALKPGAVAGVLDSIQADITLLPLATNTELRQIIGRILNRQTAIIKALRRLV